MLPAPPRASLIHRLSLTIWALFIALLLLLSVLGYVAMQAAAHRIVPLLAQQAVELKARTHEGLFLQAEQSVQRLREELVQRLDTAPAPAALARFDTLFARSSDGLWRLRTGLVNPERAPTMYLHEGTQGLDVSTRRRAVASYELLREQGPALVPPFFSAYMDFVEDGLMIYARGLDWGASATAQSSNADYPTMRGASPERNPQRKVFWTPVYFDQQAHTWMVSVIQPLDWQGRWAGTLGHDVSIQTLMDAVAAGSGDEGTRLILSADGDLIAHPDLRERIAATDGQLQIATLHDPLLEQVLHMVRSAHTDSGASITPDGNQWVAWSRIRGPGWYQVYLLPQNRVNNLLLWAVVALCCIGLLGLMPAMWLLRRQVHRLVERPLLRLAQAVDELGQGGEPTPIGSRSADELGRLAGAFDAMVAELVQQRALQSAHAKALQTEVQERRQTMASLEEERARLLALLGAMNLGILFISAQGQVAYCNAAFKRLWHVPDDAPLVGRTESDIFTEARAQVRSTEALTRQLEMALSAPQTRHQFEIELQDGRTLLLGTHPVRDADTRPVGRLWLYEDVTHERQTAAQLIHLAERDALTGLYNRRRFEEALASFLKESERTPHQGALLFFDLDEFKYINDTFGHRAGDAVLVRVASEVQALIRTSDILSRLGGDEFAVLMHHATLEDAQHLAERIVRAVAQTQLLIEDQALRLTTSLGIAHSPTHAQTAEDLLTHADAAMYQAKHVGKNRWCVYRPERDGSQEMVTRLAWNDRIARAFEGGLLRLHFQGVYRASDGQLAHLEALIRMVDEADPARLIAPGQFIGYAEKSGKILDIDRWVIRESVRMLATHPQLPALAINISGRSFDDPDLPCYIAGQLQEHGVAPARLLVELTETSAVSDLGDAERFIGALRQTGCAICLDDFGTGFASFAYLKHLRVDVLKIDGLFIRDLPQEHDNQVFVRSIIEVARGMGKHTVAEFVENDETLQMLKAFGVDMVQGYHLDKPQAQHPALSGGFPSG
ncbi:MAG: EAL domain-containing protein [Comamonadaceae bacterium]|jgi:diguanylate cyclase (GGDEF)-like protein|nr:EAL domain-containing protein [Comamonadaceae bacterium]